MGSEIAAVPPTAPTLCEGWDAHDLAVHIWVIKHDPLSWPGIVLPAFEATTARRAESFRQRWTYEGLVGKLRRESGAIAPMPLDRFEGHRHALGEYYIHTQDVRRANGLPHLTPTRQPDIPQPLVTTPDVDVKGSGCGESCQLLGWFSATSRQSPR